MDMKEKMIELLNKLFAVGENRYVHSTIGAVIASIMCCAFCWLPLWANILISVLVVSGIAVYKECGMDSKVDLIDIAFTVGGGAVVWVTLIVNILL